MYLGEEEEIHRKFIVIVLCAQLCCESFISQTPPAVVRSRKSKHQFVLIARVPKGTSNHRNQCRDMQLNSSQ